MKRYALCLMIMICAASLIPVFALNGQVITVSGKVEFQDASGVWKPLKAGDTVTSGTMISTGFKSEATVKLGASILTIKPLTRMTLTALVEKEDIVDTELFLEVGNVRAEVNSMSGKKNGFSVKSPVATASVRGTVFDFGDKLYVREGTVLYISMVGQSRRGRPGQTLQIVGQSIISPGAAARNEMKLIHLSSLPSTLFNSPILTTLSSPTPEVPEAGSSLLLPNRETFVELNLN